MTTIISADQKYRYKLERLIGGHKPPLVFCMLNPSTADDVQDDPTIRRCIGFARREQASKLVVVNVYAFRATDPKVMLAATDPIGPDNGRHILEAVEDGGNRIVCAWGTMAGQFAVQNLIFSMKACGVKLFCLGTTKDGHPRHPLYVKADQPLIPWSPR